MKQYFLKYLPIEGEIKYGDYYLNHKVNHIAQRTDGSMDKSYIGFKKVKLFLCNKEIQVGDKFNNTEIPNKEYIADVVNEKDIECYKHDCFIPRRYCYKTIGEISQDALWVKESDEFDEDEVQYDYAANVYYIKCSQCKSFH